MLPDRKPPVRELKPEFDRAAQQVLERTGTDDGRLMGAKAAEENEQEPTGGRKAEPGNPEQEPMGAKATGGNLEQHAGNKKDRGKLAGLFNAIGSLFGPHEPPPPRARPAAKPDFEKAAKPPLDLAEAFNREVENRARREENDRGLDGPGRSFDPDDPKN